MAYDVFVTAEAKRDINRAYRWWAEHRSREQALR